MLRSDILIDIPSTEERRQLSAWERARERMGLTVDASTGREALIQDVATVVEEILAGVASAGVDNVVFLTMDGSPIFVDKGGNENDLEAAIDAAVQRQSQAGQLNDVHLVMQAESLGVDVVIALHFRTPVPVGTQELRIRVSGRVNSLRIRHGEEGADYQARVRAFTGNIQVVDALRIGFRNLAFRIASSLRDRLQCPIRVEDCTVDIKRLDRKSVSRLRNLSFGKAVQTLRYSPDPTIAGPSVADPHDIVVKDPYNDLLHAFLTQAVVDGAWRSHHVRFVDESWEPLGFADETVSAEHLNLHTDLLGIGFDNFGWLSIDRSPKKNG